MSNIICHTSLNRYGGNALHSTETITFAVSATGQESLQSQNDWGPDLPLALSGHCMAKLNNETAFIVGGDVSKDVMISYNRTINKFTMLEVTLQQGRKDHACSIFQPEDSEYQWLVVVGGQSSSAGTHVKTEVLS